MDGKLLLQIILLSGIAGNICGCGVNCKEIIFNGADDERAFSELQSFLSELAGNCQMTTVTTVVKPEPTTTEPTTVQNEVTPPGNDWGTSGDIFFKCFKDKQFKYADAKKACEEFGPKGRLAAEVLRDQVAAEYIANNCVGTDKFRPWVGFDDIAKEGTWVWVDGGSMNDGTTGWNTDEPNNADEGEDCGHITKVDDGKLLLNDKECHHNLSYVCEV